MTELHRSIRALSERTQIEAALVSFMAVNPEDRPALIMRMAALIKPSGETLTHTRGAK